MECLRELAKDEFQPQTSTKFDGRGPYQQVNFIEAVLQNTVATIPDRRIINTKDVLAAMAPRDNSNISSSVRLVEVRIQYPFPFYMAQNTFLKLFESINIDPYVLHLIRLNSVGFYQFPKPSARKNDPENSSYYLSTLYYALAWSFNPKTREVKAVLLTRGFKPQPKLTETTLEFSDFVRLLQGFLPVFEVCRCPSAFLSLAVATQLVHFLDEYILSQLDDIRKAEAISGHGDMEPTGEKLDIKEIANQSKAMAGSLSVLANIQRHLEIAKAVLVHASKTAEQLQQGVKDALSVLETQLLWNESSTKYLLDRARSQIAVLQGLLSHEDALQSKKLALQSKRLAMQSNQLSLENQRLAAQSNKISLESKRLAAQSNQLSLGSQRLADQSNQLSLESKDLAIETKKDSSAMKTIAVMTMLFLPGTFFAALFALPLLQWTEPRIIQKNFWIYWAFTIPTTALVFVVWNILTGWTKSSRSIAR